MIIRENVIFSVVQCALQPGRVQSIQVNGHRMVALVVVPNGRSIAVDGRTTIARLDILILRIQNPIECLPRRIEQLVAVGVACVD